MSPPKKRGLGMVVQYVVEIKKRQAEGCGRGLSEEEEAEVENRVRSHESGSEQQQRELDAVMAVIAGGSSDDTRATEEARVGEEGGLTQGSEESPVRYAMRHTLDGAVTDFSNRLRRASEAGLGASMEEAGTLAAAYTRQGQSSESTEGEREGGGGMTEREWEEQLFGTSSDQQHRSDDEGGGGRQEEQRAVTALEAVPSTPVYDRVGWAAGRRAGERQVYGRGAGRHGEVNGYESRENGRESGYREGEGGRGCDRRHR